MEAGDFRDRDGAAIYGALNFHIGDWDLGVTLNGCLHQGRGQSLFQRRIEEKAEGNHPYSQREKLSYGSRGNRSAICKAPDASNQPSGCNLSQVYWRLGEQDARGNAVKETCHDSLALQTRRRVLAASNR